MLTGSTLRMLKQAYAESKVIETITGFRTEPLLVFSQRSGPQSRLRDLGWRARSCSATLRPHGGTGACGMIDWGDRAHSELRRAGL